jgi:hypothetical protein
VTYRVQMLTHPPGAAEVVGPGGWSRGTFASVHAASAAAADWEMLADLRDLARDAGPAFDALDADPGGPSALAEAAERAGDRRERVRVGWSDPPTYRGRRVETVTVRGELL